MAGTVVRLGSAVAEHARRARVKRALVVQVHGADGGCCLGRAAIVLHKLSIVYHHAVTIVRIGVMVRRGYRCRVLMIELLICVGIGCSAVARYFADYGRRR